MKKGLLGIIGLVVILFAVIGFLVVWNFVGTITGNVVGGPGGPIGGPDDFGGGMMGPSDSEMACMVECTSRGCDESDMECKTSASGACGVECGVETEAPKPANGGEECMQKCVLVGCDKFDFSCQRLNQEGCDEECGMKGDAPDEGEMDEEQRCISECVAKEDPTMICGNSQEGETGGALCQKCASECEHLYEGPCLNDEELTAKEKECETCEHCYGSPVTGPSGQGWDCIVDISCGDASAEFGDDAGTGDASFEEGHEGPGIVAEFFEGIGDFFKGLFGGE
jgi:hypothetical protein